VRSDVAWALLLAIAAVRLLLQVFSAGLIGYGYSADELYFLDCADHLAWGYVDHPPFSIAVLASVRGAFGDWLLCLRLAAAFAGATTIVLAGLITRDLGGGRAAQGIAALAMLVSPVVLFVTGYYSMNAIDMVIWSIAFHLMLRVLNGGDQRLWIALGFTLGIGLLNKWSVLWLGGGLGVGLLLSPQRTWLRTPWPWLAGVIAVLIWAPNLVWQVRHDWPTLEFMRTGMRDVMAEKPPLTFVREQFRAMHPILALLTVFGLFHYFRSDGSPHRLLGWTWVTVFIILMTSGTARPYYLAPAYAVTFAAGAVFIERLAKRRRWSRLPQVAAGLIALAGVVPAPLVVPLLSPEAFIAYERKLGMSRVKTEFDEGELPPQFGFQFGWAELTEAVARTYEELPPEDKARAGILAETFGEAGGLNFFGKRIGLPHAIGTHNNYWLWGPQDCSGDVMIVVSDSEEKLRGWFASVEPGRKIACQYCMPTLRAKSVYVCRSPRRPLRELWPELKNYS